MILSMTTANDDEKRIVHLNEQIEAEKDSRILALLLQELNRLLDERREHASRRARSA